MENKNKQETNAIHLWKLFVILGASSGISLLVMILVTFLILDSLPKLVVCLDWVSGILFVISGFALLLQLAFTGRQAPSKAVFLERRALCQSAPEIVEILKHDLLSDSCHLQGTALPEDADAQLDLFMCNSTGKTEINAVLQVPVLAQTIVDHVIDLAFHFIEEQGRIYTRTLFTIFAFVETEDDYLSRFICEFTGQGPNAGEYAIAIVRESGEMISSVRENGSFQKQFLSISERAHSRMYTCCNKD